MTQVMSIVKTIAKEELDPPVTLDELDEDKVDEHFTACAERLYAKAKTSVNVGMTQRFDQLSISTLLNNMKINNKRDKR